MKYSKISQIQYVKYLIGREVGKFSKFMSVNQSY